ncbi:MAG: hypothetical protein J6T74_06485 [Clostridia bacterium]|nr:hypothetical protein [Clostridia bacterium]
MFGLMLVNDFINDYLLTVPRILGMSLIAIGIAIAFVSKRLTRVIKKTDTIDSSDKTYVTILTVALIVILVGMIVCIF